MPDKLIPIIAQSGTCKKYQVSASDIDIVSDFLIQLSKTKEYKITFYYTNNTGFNLYERSETGDNIVRGNDKSSYLNKDLIVFSAVGFVVKFSSVFLRPVDTFTIIVTEVTSNSGGGGTSKPSNLALGIITEQTIPITNDNGTGVILPSATETEAGLMSGNDKKKLDSIDPSEEVADILYLDKRDFIENQLDLGLTIYDAYLEFDIDATTPDEAPTNIRLRKNVPNKQQRYTIWNGSTPNVVNIRGYNDTQQLILILALDPLNKVLITYDPANNILPNIYKYRIRYLGISSFQTATNIKLKDDSQTGIVLSSANSSFAGLMTAADNIKLNKLPTGIKAGQNITIDKDISTGEITVNSISSGSVGFPDLLKVGGGMNFLVPPNAPSGTFAPTKDSTIMEELWLREEGKILTGYWNAIVPENSANQGFAVYYGQILRSDNTPYKINIEILETETDPASTAGVIGEITISRNPTNTIPGRSGIGHIIAFDETSFYFRLKDSDYSFTPPSGPDVPKGNITINWGEDPEAAAGKGNYGLRNITIGGVFRIPITNPINGGGSGGDTILSIENQISDGFDIKATPGNLLSIPKATQQLAGLMSGSSQKKLDFLSTDYKRTVAAATVIPFSLMPDGSVPYTISGSTLTWKENGVLTIDNITTWKDVETDGASSDINSNNPCDIVLIKNEGDETNDKIAQTTDGIFFIQNKGAVNKNIKLTRCVETLTGDLLKSGSIISVRDGIINSKTQWMLMSLNPIIIGTTPLIFQKIGSNSPIIEQQRFIPHTLAGQNYGILEGQTLTRIIQNTTNTNIVVLPNLDTAINDKDSTPYHIWSDITSQSDFELSGFEGWTVNEKEQINLSPGDYAICAAEANQVKNYKVKIIRESIVIETGAYSEWVNKDANNNKLTVNIVSDGATNPTKGTIVLDQLQYRRNLDEAKIVIDYEQNTAGTAGVGNYLLDLTQSGLAINLDKFPIGHIIGMQIRFTTSNTTPLINKGLAQLKVVDATKIAFDINLFIRTNNAGEAFGAFDSSVSGYNFSNTFLKFSGEFTILIAGWNVTQTNAPIQLTTKGVVFEETASIIKSSSSIDVIKDTINQTLTITLNEAIVENKWIFIVGNYEMQITDRRIVNTSNSESPAIFTLPILNGTNLAGLDFEIKNKTSYASRSSIIVSPNAGDIFEDGSFSYEIKIGSSAVFIVTLENKWIIK